MATTPALAGLSLGLGALPGTTSAKNMMLSPAAADLGMGDALKQQLQDQLDERKKAKDPAAAASSFANPLISSPAVLSLFSQNRSM